MHRSFVEPDWINSWLKDPKTQIPQEALRRLISIVRVKAGEKIGFFDGGGRQVIGNLDKNNLENAYLDSQPQASPQIILAQAACAENKISETLRRGCEFGVDKFIIYEAQKSESYCFDKLKKRYERLEAILIDASRQSERLWVPELIFIDNLTNILNIQGVFGDLNSPEKLSQILIKKYDSSKDFIIIIGPEGGLNNQEIKLLHEAGLAGVRWGPYTQRTELAGLAAVSLINAFCGRA